MILISRPLIITIMGHVNHGKTSLLDAIRLTNDITPHESGGITQKVSYYYFRLHNNNFITVLDTPGHEIFDNMRGKSVNIADVSLVVISSDEGIKSQTREVIMMSQRMNIPIIIVISKIDVKNTKMQKIYKDLLHLNIIEHDGKNIVKISSKNKTGLLELKNVIISYSRKKKLLINLNENPSGIVLEYKCNNKYGPIVILLLQKGVLRKKNSIILIGDCFFRIRNLLNDVGNNIKVATPSMPVQVTGITFIPKIGDKFIAVKNEKILKKNKIGLNSHSQSLINNANNNISLKLIIKADFYSSLDTIISKINNISHDKIKIVIISHSVGVLNKTDIKTSLITGAKIICFNIRPSKDIIKLAHSLKVSINKYMLVHNIIIDVKNMINNKLLANKIQIHGYAKIEKIFSFGKHNIAGCQLTRGYIMSYFHVRVIRDKIVLYNGPILSLKRFSKDIDKIKDNEEFSILLKNFSGIKKNDIIEAYS